MQQAAPQDVQDLADHLDALVEEMTADAEKKLAERGEREAKEMRALLESQRTRIQKQKAKTDGEAQQLTLKFADVERKQLASDRRHWERRLIDLEQEIETEPERIRQAYQVKASRVEPVGLVYLWPVSQ